MSSYTRWTLFVTTAIEHNTYIRHGLRIGNMVDVPEPEAEKPIKAKTVPKEVQENESGAKMTIPRASLTDCRPKTTS